MVMQADGLRFVIETPKGLGTASSDHFSDTRTLSVNDTRWRRALNARTLYEVMEEMAQEGQQYASDSFKDHQ